jgi:copper(I)-binding protein
MGRDCAPGEAKAQPQDGRVEVSYVGGFAVEGCRGRCAKVRKAEVLMAGLRHLGRQVFGVVATGLLLSGGAARADAPAVTIETPWVRFLLPSIPAAAYMTLRNGGDTDMLLTGAATPACGMLMLHKSQDNSGMSMMMDVTTITIPAHGAVTLAPGGYHLMCMQPRMKVGDTVHLTLTFADGATVAATAEVYGAQSGP